MLNYLCFAIRNKLVFSFSFLLFFFFFTWNSFEHPSSKTLFACQEKSSTLKCIAWRQGTCPMLLKWHETTGTGGVTIVQSDITHVYSRSGQITKFSVLPAILGQIWWIGEQSKPRNKSASIKLLLLTPVSFYLYYFVLFLSFVLSYSFYIFYFVHCFWDFIMSRTT